MILNKSSTLLKKIAQRKINMDIGSGYPAANLSNFHPHQFTIDNIEYASMEGFLQSLKFKDPNMQIEMY